MKLYILFTLILSLMLAACSSTSSGDITGPGAIASGTKTCIRSVSSTLPGGTKAIRQSDSAVAILDANGCYEFSTASRASGVAFRAMESDSVQLYNDSALFAVTLPYVTGGDTINVVPTIVTLRDVPNSEVDSVFLIAYDRVHVLSRKVKLRRSNYGDTSDFARTLWSRDDGANVLVHFQTNGKKILSSSVYDVEPGSMTYRTWAQMKKSSVPVIVHGEGGLANSNLMAAKMGNIDTMVLSSVKFIKIRATSIYGISKIETENGTDSIDVSEVYSRVGHDFLISLTDSAGYTAVDTFRIIRADSLKPYGACQTMTVINNLRDTTAFCAE